MQWSDDSTPPCKVSWLGMSCCKASGQVMRREDEPVKLNAVAWQQQSLNDVSAEVARAIMKLADRLSHNSQLSVTEMDTFLRGTPYEAFSSWMLMEYQRNFKQFDQDKDGAITLDELQAAVRAFMEEQKQVQESQVDETQQQQAACSPPASEAPHHSEV